MIVNGISERLRARRLELGLSLRDLALRTGTSAAALSRYEKGWDRFELFTIRKLASALGCSVSIKLEPLVGERINLPASAVIRKLRRLFWDRPLTVSDLQKYPSWVVRRILEYGTLDDVRGIISIIGRSEFLRIVSDTRFASRKTGNFWKEMLRQEGLTCTKKRYPGTAQIF